MSEVIYKRDKDGKMRPQSVILARAKKAAPKKPVAKKAE